MKLKSCVMELEKQFQGIKDDLIKQLEVISDNPKITRLRTGAFTISSSNLGFGEGVIFSAFFHDNQAQIRALKDIIQTSDNTASLLKELEMIAKTGRSSRAQYKSERFNKTVMASVGQML